ncbi:hypothetical protein [Azorhizophilus paspali]|uniref:PEGA domain-containing protein n=1 Tax=Azorhizophilus paspali TaxID=69963 RepID=A0ABV6SJE6_AZOPA
MPLRVVRITVIMSAASVVTGCASLFGETQYPVAISSFPPGANYKITNQAGESIMSGVTPDQPTLKSSAGYFDGERYEVEFTKDGYESETEVLDSGIDGWYWWNILIGGLIGMLIVDPITGAMYDLPEKVHAHLLLDRTPAQTQPVAPATRPVAPDAWPVVPAARPVAPAARPATSASSAKSKDQLLNELAADKSISFEEYQRRYQIIMREP